MAKDCELNTWKPEGLFLNVQMNESNPDSKVHGANMGPIWGRQDPGGPHVGPMIFAIWEIVIQVMVKTITWVNV